MLSSRPSIRKPFYELQTPIFISSYFFFPIFISIEVKKFHLSMYALFYVFMMPVYCVSASWYAAYWSDASCSTTWLLPWIPTRNARCSTTANGAASWCSLTCYCFCARSDAPTCRCTALSTSPLQPSRFVTQISPISTINE